MLGRLFLDGVTETLWPYVQAVPELRAAYPTAFSPDNAAATHHHLFAFQLFPYESFFRAETGLSGGPIAGAVAQFYQQAGFDAAADAPDHLGHELAFLAYLTQKEANSWDNQQQALAHTWQQQQQRFLSNHLLNWLVPFVVALQRAAPTSFYDTLAQLTLELVADHAAALNHSLAAIPLPAISDPLPTLSDNPRPWEFVHFWVTPAHSGLFLSRDDISQVAHRAGVVPGFGKREEMLKTVLDAAATAATLPYLFQTLTQFSHYWRNAYDQISTEFPQLIPFITPWQERVHQVEQWVGLVSREQ